jgi:hypothetical protein
MFGIPPVASKHCYHNYYWMYLHQGLFYECTLIICFGCMQQVKVYTPKRLFHQLEAAKEEFVRATAGVWKEQKLLLPKLLEAYAKDVKLSPQGLVDMVQRYLPESMRMAVQRCSGRSASKVVEWVPYVPSFRYLLARDLAFPHLS